MNRRILLSLLASLLVGGLVRGAPPDSPPAKETPATHSSPPSADLPAPHPVDSVPGPDGVADAPAVEVAPGGQEDSPPLWARAEFLLWWMRGERLPPLVTSSVPGTPVDVAGALGNPALTTTLIGNEEVNREARPGGRFTLGYWFSDHETCGIEASFLVLADRSLATGTSSNGTPILARPYFNAEGTSSGGPSGAPLSQIIAYPGQATGRVTVNTTSRGLLGGEVNFEEVYTCGGPCRLTALVGWRSLRFDESFAMNQFSMATSDTNPFGVGAGTNLTFADSFQTQNTFNGLNLGFLLDVHRDSDLTIGLVTKLAVGFTHETVDINGFTQATPPGGPTTTATGGFLALPTNIGRFRRNDDVAVVPEVGLNVEYQVTDRVRLYGGYTLLYWSRMVRAANQIDLSINPSQLLPTHSFDALVSRPTFQLQASDFWAQGIDLGLEFRY